MKFLSLTLLLGLIALPQLGKATSVVAEINFTRINNLGIKKSDHLKIFKDHIKLGLITLKSNDAKKIASWFRDFKSVTTNDSCRAGTFEVVKIVNNSKSVEKGCAEGPAYGELMQQFQRLQNLAKKESAHGS